MNPNLEALVKSYDAFRQAHGDIAKELWSIYEAQRNSIAEETNVSRENLHKGVLAQHRAWLHAQKGISTLPPRA
jgi:hypothetical protein